MPYFRRALPALLCIALTAAAPGSRAADEDESIRPRQYAADELQMRIDGRLDEAVWSEARVHDDFRIIEPDTLLRPGSATEVRFAYTDAGLYVGVTAEQDPDTLVARLTPRDARINRDTISITIDPTGAGLYGYWFAVSLGDSLTDGTVVPEREFSNQWDGPWRGASARTDTGWSAEFFLPWSMMAMPATDAARQIGFYISRKVAHLDQRWAMPALPQTQPQFMSVLRPIHLAGVQPRRQLTFYPFAAATGDIREGDLESRVGTDIYWRPDPNLQLSATLNPDFGTVEQDDVVVNLSAFEVFFSERRAFFLEGQEIFITSPRAAGNYNGGPPLLLLNTRRVGAGPSLPQRPGVSGYAKQDRIRLSDLLGAGKLTGQIGGLRYGLLTALERDSEVTAFDAAGAAFDVDVDGRRFTAARGLWEQSERGSYRAIGGTLTSVVQPGSDGHVAAVDAHLLSADGRWKLDAQAMGSAALDRRGVGMIGDVVFTPRQGLTHSLGVEAFDTDFDINDFGFLARNDQVLVDYRFREQRSDLEDVRERRTQLLARNGVNLDGLLVSSGFFLEREWQFHDLSRVSVNLGLRPQRWDDRNSRGNGAFRVDTRGVAELEWRSDDSRQLSGGIEGGLRHEDLQGLSWDADVFLIWRPLDQFTADLSLQYKDRDDWLVHRRGREFATFDAIEWRPSFTLDYFLSARQQLRATMQWVGVQAREDGLLQIGPNGSLVDRPRLAGGPDEDFSISSMVLQLRYRWEIAPLSDLFLVYTRGGNLDDPDERDFSGLLSANFDDPDQDQLVLKLRYRIGS